MHRRILALALVALAGTSSPAAAWVPNGAALSLAANVQSAPLAAPDGQGGAYVVWLDTRAGNSDLYVQHVTAAGAIAAGWADDGLAVCNDASVPNSPRIAADGQGNAYVTWTDARAGNPDVYVQKLASGGIAAGWTANGVLVCGAAAAQANPVLIASAAGALIAWSDLRGANENVYVHHVLPVGAVDGAWPVNGALLSGALQQQAFPTIVTDGVGGAIVAWEDGRNGGALTAQLDIYAGHMRSTGAADSTWGADGTLLCLSPGFAQSRPLAESDGSGGAIVAWRDTRHGNGDLYATRILGSGVIASGWPGDGAEVVRLAGEQLAPVLVGDGQGGAIFAWQDGRDTSSFPTNTDIFAVRLLSNGARAAGWSANGNNLSIHPARQDDPAICSDGTGGALLAWADGRPGAEIYGQHVKGDGTLAPGWTADGLPICTAVNSQVDPTLVSDGAGGGVCAWEDYRNSLANHDIYAQRFLGSGEVGPVVGALDPALPAAVGIAFAGAHPARGGARFAVTLPEAARATAAVFNPAGRRVAELWSGDSRAPGRHVVAWDGADAAGRAAPPGMYYLEVLADGHRAALRFVFLP